MAASLFIVILAQSAATSRAYAVKYGERFNENTDLVGLGFANLAAGFSSTFVVNGSPTKTEMVDEAKSHTQVAQLTTAAVVAVVLLFLTKPLQYLPNAVLSSVVFLIGLKLIDLRGMREILRLRKDEFVVALVTALVVIGVGVEQGIILAIVLSLVLHVRRHYAPVDVVLTWDDRGGVKAQVPHPGVMSEPGLVVYRFGAGIFFANAQRLSDEILELASGDSPPRWIILDGSSIDDVDFSGGKTLGELAASSSGAESCWAWPIFEILSAPSSIATASRPRSARPGSSRRPVRPWRRSAPIAAQTRSALKQGSLLRCEFLIVQHTAFVERRDLVERGVAARLRVRRLGGRRRVTQAALRGGMQSAPEVALGHVRELADDDAPERLDSNRAERADDQDHHRIACGGDRRPDQEHQQHQRVGAVRDAWVAQVRRERVPRARRPPPGPGEPGAEQEQKRDRAQGDIGAGEPIGGHLPGDVGGRTHVRQGGQRGDEVVAEHAPDDHQHEPRRRARRTRSPGASSGVRAR